ncbi:hypothetical protein [Amycolatopsis regifaucium]|uniref:Primosomal protein n=1 Tax=Amycolatopsis regifaucium TaxID=546365 RepID=A0A154M5E3_9PSEU|nr:hypothetical protein AVL48_14535 [Amycolatopsis regifaucium]OKA10053.1 hypothetical protein ATP06_0206880 [Amycolatopsis regifaucium]SFI63242.1 hypothetical protein SAMN04489731_1129 [Amycolatopsis regifaucium]
MAQDIVPIELGLPQGDVVTLWAPRWRQEGDKREAFLGQEDDLYAFPDVAHLAAFVRTESEHGLSDHPSWRLVPPLSVAQLTPTYVHKYDLVGVPELVAGERPTPWAITKLVGIVAVMRSLADMYELDEVTDVLDKAKGFAILAEFKYDREGERLWGRPGHDRRQQLGRRPRRPRLARDVPRHR